jgi:hypothetical protein
VGVELEAAAGHLDAFPHGHQREVAVADQGRAGLRLEADAVVADLEVDPVGAAVQLQPEPARLGVAGHVQQRLLGDPVDDRLQPSQGRRALPTV